MTKRISSKRQTHKLKPHTATEPRQLYGGRKPKSYRLAHNQVMHTPEFMHGVNGFRRFWIPPSWIERGEWIACPCGWRSEAGTHYAVREHAGWWRREIAKRGGVEVVHKWILRQLAKRGLFAVVEQQSDLREVGR